LPENAVFLHLFLYVPFSKKAILYLIAKTAASRGEIGRKSRGWEFAGCYFGGKKTAKHMSCHQWQLSERKKLIKIRRSCCSSTNYARRKKTPNQNDYSRKYFEL